MFVVLNTFDKTNPDYPAGICYDYGGRTPALLTTKLDAFCLAKNLTENNPGSVYQIYQLVEVK